MSNPSLNAKQLNQLLIPKTLIGKTATQQIQILNRNAGGERTSILNTFFILQGSANRIPRRNQLLYLRTSTGTSFALNAAQQISLYYYLISNRTTGLAYLLFQSRQIQAKVDRMRQRAINSPS